MEFEVQAETMGEWRKTCGSGRGECEQRKLFREDREAGRSFELPINKQLHRRFVGFGMERLDASKLRWKNNERVERY
jgi:hypothetical protein